MGLKLVYVAGKYRGPTTNDIWHNIMLARLHGEAIAMQGDMPVIPHTNGAFMDGIQTDEFWLEGTMEMLRRCDAIYLLPHWKQSIGARAEWKEAKRLKIPLYEIRNKRLRKTKRV